MIHRDVKLDNILFNEISGETTLIDFEAAILIGTIIIISDWKDLTLFRPS